MASKEKTSKSLDDQSVETLAEVFSCFICMEKLKDAHLCPYCSKLCCYECIRGWLVTETRQHCPHCRKILGLNEFVRCCWGEEVTQQLNNLQTASGDVGKKDPEYGRCSEHEKKLTVYCLTCKKCLCHQCALWGDGHTSHKFKPLEGLYEQCCSQIKEDVAQLEKRHTEMSNLLEKVNLNEECVRIANEEQVDKIVRAVGVVIDRLEAQLKSKLSTLTDRKSALTAEVSQLEELLKESDHQLTSGSKLDLISRSTDFSQIVHQLCRKPISSYATAPVSADFQSGSLFETLTETSEMASSSSPATVSSRRTCLAARKKFPLLPTLKLPEGRYFVHVTLARSTTEVWLTELRLNENNSYDDLLDEMDSSFEGVKPEDHVTTPEVGNYYALKFNDRWVRVKLTEMKDGACHCYLIDIGGLNDFSVEQLFTLNPTFLKLPAQAVKCSLYGFEGYADSPQAQAFLNYIQGNCFNADIKSSKEPYLIKLYDTSDEEHHMGVELLESLNNKNYVSLLQQVGNFQHDVKTYVTHVSQTGDIYVQFVTSHFELLQSLIENITPLDEEANKVTKLFDVHPGEIYLAQFSDHEWYRATVTHVTSKNDIEVFFLEYGNSYSVSLSELLSLDKLPNHLSQILPQAVLVHLDSVPLSIFSEKLVDKIRDLVQDEEVLVKRKTYEDVPRVEIFVRHGPQEMLISVNNTIINDPEFS